jgi:ferrochelatase
MTPRKIGVIVAQLGTPDAPTAKALRPYLHQFLSDQRVIDYPAWIWQPILRGIILRSRPKRSAKLYERIWMPEGSPLQVYTARQTSLLRIKLAERIQAVPLIKYAMSIGNPSIGAMLQEMKEQGCERILIFPLYPQYAASSTAYSVQSPRRDFRASSALP